MNECENCPHKDIELELRLFYRDKINEDFFNNCKNPISSSCKEKEFSIKWENIEKYFNKEKEVLFLKRKIEDIFFEKYNRKINKKIFLEKNKKYFYNFALKVYERDNINLEKLIEVLFRINNNEVFPPMLNNDKIFEYYENLKNEIIIDNEEDELEKELEIGVKKLKNKSIKDFLEKPGNKFDVLSNKFNLRLFCFSKYFNIWYEDNEDKFNKRINLFNCRYRVIKYAKLVKKIKEYLKEDYYEKEE